jgi:hypothetical protein
VRTWLFGYGPDTFSTVFPLAASERTRLPSQAHNHLLQLLVEVGALGLLAHLVLVGIALFTGARFLWRERNSYSESAARSIVVAAILAAIVAWSVEQLVGVPRVSDLVLFWLLLGALAAVASGRGLQPDADARYGPIQRTRIRSAASMVGAMAAVAACIWWIYAWNVNSVRADVMASQAVMSQDPDAAYVLADRAMELSRGQASYRQIAGDVREKKLRTLTDLQARALVAEELYVIRYLAWQQHPFSGLARIGLADGALELARLGYPGKADEAIGIYRNVIETTRQQRPLHRQIEMSIAVAYIESGRSHEAAGILAVLLTDEALATGSRMNALYLQGAALFELGEQTNAALSLEQALQMDYDQDTEAASHSLLSKVYSAMGETSLAERHAQLHAELVAAR